MNYLVRSAGTLLATMLGGCSGHPTAPTDTLTFTFDFRRGPQGFVAGFADYPPGDEDIYELTSDHRALPPPLPSEAALFISGVNRSDDLFMFFKGPVEGLLPGASYDVTVSVEIATDVIEEAIRSTLRGETGSRAAFVLRDASVDGSGMQAEFRRRSPVEASGRHVRRAGRLTAADTPC